mgnify:CR=1 FL=1
MKDNTQAKKRRNHVAKKRAITWRKQAGWLVKTITELHESPAAHGIKWKAGMVTHYVKTYHKIRANSPPSCEQAAIEYDSKINAIVEYYAENT